MNKFLEAVELLSSNKYISKSLSKKITLNFLKDLSKLEEFKKYLFNLEKIEICNICYTLKEKDFKCQNCIKKSKKIIIVENIEEALEIQENIYESEKIFSLGFFNKKNYLDYQKINFFIDRFKKFLFFDQENYIKDIIISIPYSIETKIIIDLLKKEKIDKNIKTLPIGVSFNSNLKSFDKETLRRALDNSEKI